MKFQIILADPPWWYADQKKVRKDGRTPTRGIGACHHYGQMKTSDLCALDVAGVVAARCHLYLWATMPLLPDALRAMAAWGFAYSTVAFCWIKCNSKRWVEAQAEVMQGRLFAGSGFAEVEAFMDALTFFGPGFYTGSNIELVLLGTRGRPFHHAPGHKAAQVLYAPLGGHSAKPEAVQDRIEWMYPDLMPGLELFGRRSRPCWMVVGNESPESLGEDIRGSLQRLKNL